MRTLLKDGVIGVLLARSETTAMKKALDLANARLDMLLALFIVFVADETGERWSIRGQDARRVTLALVLLLAYLVVLALPATRAIFDLAAPTAAQLTLTIAGAIVWLIVLRWSLRVRLLDAAIGAPRAR